MSGDLYYMIPKGTFLSLCRLCGTKVWWVKAPDGEMVPVESNGKPHWEVCAKIKEMKDKPVETQEKDTP